MKKVACVFFLMLIATAAVADSFVLNNQISKPTHHKIVIQWATSAKDVEENNTQLKQGKKLNPHSLQTVTRAGKINLNIPKNAEYFRILEWTKGTIEPDFLTNWVDIMPKKTYTLNQDILIPFVLISGMGC